MKLTKGLALSALLFAAASLPPNVLSASAASTERFAGEARVGNQSPFSGHIELNREDNAATGIISTPGDTFELANAHGENPIVGRFRGGAGGGAVSLHVEGDVLTAHFDLEGQPGTMTARRTTDPAETFFRRPEQRLDLKAAQWRDDLDRAVHILTSEHASPFHRVSPDEFQREVARVRAAIPELDGMGLALELRKIAALIGDGHTSVELPRGEARLPIEFYVFDDELRVVSVASPHGALLGAKLTALNEVPSQDVAERLRAYIPQGETEWFDRATMPQLLSRPELLRAIGLGGGPHFTFRFETEGQQVEANLSPAEQEEQVALGGREPLWQRNKAQPFWIEWVSDDQVYVNWRSYDRLADHSAALLQVLDARRPRQLIVDLRDNGGGDFNAGRLFIDAIRGRPWLNRRGVLYVMVGRKTFSAAMTNAVDFKQTTEAILVGEPSGAAPNNWQEGGRLYLPNSGLRVSVSTRYYAFLPGQLELVPDHQISPLPSDWGSGHDAGVRFILAQPVR